MYTFRFLAELHAVQGFVIFQIDRTSSYTSLYIRKNTDWIDTGVFV